MKVGTQSSKETSFAKMRFREEEKEVAALVIEAGTRK